MLKHIKIIGLLLVISINTQMMLAQSSKVLSGHVYEMYQNSKEAAIGVNVAFYNSQNRLLIGTITNVNGEYFLKVPQGEKNLTVRFSFVGMKTQSFVYSNQNTLDVLMKENVTTLKAVEVVGESKKTELGITEREKTFATQTISMGEIMEITPITSVEEALQGRMSGVDILESGDPGAKSSIRIRGTATLNTNADPLIVINGVPYSASINDNFDFSTANQEDFADMLNISPYDIETIEVLKDAASTAVYGTKGANGVLLITTKKGHVGKPKFSFTSKYISKHEPQAIQMLTGKEYTAYVQDAIWNTANATGVDNNSYLLQLLFDTPELNYNKSWRYYDEYACNTDWLSYVAKDAYTSDNSFSMSGGGEKATYRFSLGYLDEGGTTLGTNLKRFTSTLNIQYIFSSKLRVNADFSYTNSKKKAPWTENVRAEALRKMPNKSPFWIDEETGLATSRYFTRQNIEEFQGSFVESDDPGKSENFHPIAMALSSYNNSYQDEDKMNFRLDYEILPGLNYTGYVSLKLKIVKNRKFLPQEATGVTMDSRFANRSTDAYSDDLALQTENKLIYRKNWEKKHNLVLTALWNTAESESSSYSSTISGVAAEGLSDPVSGGRMNLNSTYSGTLNSGDSKGRSLRGSMNVNYTLLDRYTIQGNLNEEGNSSLGKSNRWGMFPSLGAAWHLESEPFMAETKNWLDEAKIRISYGESGDAPSSVAPYVGTYTSLGTYIDNPVIAPSSIQLNKLKWQTKREVDAGFDLSFFNGRLKSTFDWYYNYTDDLLQKDVFVPSTIGYNSRVNRIAYYNSGAISNQGWEYRIDYEILKKDDWLLTTNFNISRNINRIEELPDNLSKTTFTVENGSYAQKIMSGAPVGSFFGFKYLGVYQNTDQTYALDEENNVMMDYDGNKIVMKNNGIKCFPGDAKYDDINHDGNIDEKDVIYIGNCMPLATGGSGFTVKYKSLSLTTFFHYRIGQKIINRARMNAENMFDKDNQSTAVLRRWREEGDNTNIPRALYNYGYNWLGSDRFVEECSFIRLKTVSLNYSIPKDLCKKLGLNSVNTFLTAYDLFTWTDYTGQDPEVNLPSSIMSLAVDNSQTPRSKRFSIGCTINF